MRVKIIKLVFVVIGVILAGLLALVYGQTAGIGNAILLKGAIYSAIYALVILFFVYIYMKSQKTETIVEIKNDSICITRSKHAEDQL